MMDYGIYAHVPWCKVRCPYCAFNVFVDKNPPYAQWRDGVLRDWSTVKDQFQGRGHSLFFGGGTPSLAPPEAIGAIIERLPLLPDAEITLEANPGTLSPERLAAFRAVGITRVSVGVQTFNPRFARLLNRAHTAAQSQTLVQMVADAGFRSWSLDLIFALPGQRLADLQHDLDALLAVQPPHVSLYGLTFEEGTPFTRALRAGKIQAPGEELWRAQYDLIVETLEANGWNRYEVSNFSRPGHQAVHNSRVWRGGFYAGLGPGAHGFLPDGRRTFAHPRWEDWLQTSFANVERPTPTQAALDYLITAIRHVDGINARTLKDRWGVRLSAHTTQNLVQRQLLHHEGERFRLVGEGWALVDGLTVKLAETMTMDKCGQVEERDA